MPANKETEGLLARLDIDAISITHIGKETNLLEQQEEGVLMADPQVAYWGGGEWAMIQPYLDRVSISELARRSGVSARRLRELRQGDEQPKAKNLSAIIEALAQMLDEAEG
jgi:hypothetical protein